MDIIKTPTVEHLDIPGRTLTEHTENRSREFPDGEVYVQLEGIDTVDEATVIHSGMPSPNKGLMYLYGVLDILKIHNITPRVVFTYFPYSRQDQEFHDGTLNYARSIVKKLSEYYHVKNIRALDPHFDHLEWTEKFPVGSLHAFGLIREAVKMDDYRVLVPDLGATQRFGIEGFEKERINSQEVALSGDFDLKGENVLVFDDMIATGGTMIETYKKVKELGANRVEAAAVHGVMPGGVRKVKDRFDRLYLTNTIESELSNVDIEPILRKHVIGEADI